MLRSSVLVFAILAIITLGASAQVSVVLAPSPQFDSVTSNGSPNALGCVFTYISGTATPLATYTDSTGLTQNTNPVILSSAGTANIWIQSGVAYTFTVKSFGGINCVSGQTLYSVRGIAGGNSSLITTVPFSATPLFTVTSQNQVFEMTLTGNAASQPLAFSGVAAPAFITFQITEDAVGGHTFTFPANALGAASINVAANQTTTQTFIWNGTSTTAIGPATYGTSGPTFDVGTLIASSSVNSLAFISLAANPAASGLLRLSSTDTINWRNNANNADLLEIAKNASDQLLLGVTGNSVIYNGPLTSSTGNDAASGTIRLANSDTLCIRNFANSADVCFALNGNNIFSLPTGIAMSAGGISCAINSQSANYAATRNDCIIYANAVSGAITITLPTSAIGQLWIISRVDTTTNTVTISPASGTINNLATVNLPIGGTMLCNSTGTNFYCTQPVGDTRDFSVTGCTPASSTDSQCTGSISISPAMVNNSYIPMLTVNGNGGSVPNLTINVNGSLVNNSIPYNISCTFSCGSVNAPTIYVHIQQK